MNKKQALYANLRHLPWSKKLIIFAHMPKTAGISLNTVMKKQYGVKRVLELDPKKPQEVYNEVISLPFETILRLRAFSGHVIWGIHEWLPRPFIYITVLRDPVERVLSTYSYMLSSVTHRLHDEMVKDAMTLEEFLEWDRSSIEVNNLQSKLLSGLDPYQENYMPTVFMEARYNLEHYCLVGLTGHFKESLGMFSSLFGWRDVQIERDNVTPNRIRREEVSLGTIHKIEQLNQYDLELYAFAQHLFAEQSRDIRAAYARKRTQ